MRYYFTSKIGNTRHVLSDGSLLCKDVPIARTGEQEYAESELPGLVGVNGKIIVTRPPEEVFRPESLASFEGMSLTYHHPPEAITPENWKKYSVGQAQNVRRGEGEQSDLVIADLIFKDSMSIKAILNGVVEISCGYDAEYSQDEPGRVTQYNIIGNHVSHLPDGRAGSRCAVQDHKFIGVRQMPKGIKGLVRVARRAIFAKDEAAAQEALEKIEDEAMESEEASSEPGEKKTFDAEGEVNTLKEQISGIQDSLAQLLEGGSTPTGDEEAENEKEGGLTGDAAGDIVSKAEMIMPGINIPQKVTQDFKRTVLSAVKLTADGQSLLSQIGVAGADFQRADKMTVDVAFNAASALAQQRNMLPKTFRTADSNQPASPRTNAELNKFFANHYHKE